MDHSGGFGTCPGCGREINLALMRCPYCRAALSGQVLDEVELAALADPPAPPGPPGPPAPPGYIPEKYLDYPSSRFPDLGNMVLRSVAAVIDLVPVVLLFVGFARRWGRFGDQPDGTWQITLYNLPLLGYAALVFGFYLIQEGVAATTVGKWVVGLRVMTPGITPAGWVEATKRTVLRPIDFLPVLYLVGFISAMSGEGRMRLGDRIARTHVMSYRRPRPLPAGDQGVEAVTRTRPQPPGPGRVSAMWGVWLAVLALGVFTAATGEGVPERLSLPDQEALRPALLHRHDVERVLGDTRDVLEVPIEDANLLENPDPRGPCGSTGEGLGALPINAASWFQTDDLIIQHVVQVHPDAPYAFEATRADMRPGCPSFYTDTPYGHRQFNQFTAIIPIGTYGDDSAAYSLRLGPEGAGSMWYAETSMVRLGDAVSSIIIIGVEPLPAGLLDDLTAEATGKVDAVLPLDL